MRGNSLHGNRETLEASAPPNARKVDGGAERPEKANGRTSGLHAFGESDGSIVPAKRANKAGASAAEAVEGRGPTQGNGPQALHVPDSFTLRLMVSGAIRQMLIERREPGNCRMAHRTIPDGA